MATYTPLPFVPARFDQTAQKLSLAQMMYEAEMARIGMEQQRRLQVGQTLASLGSLPGQFMDVKNQLDQQALMQQQRQQQLDIERDYRQGLIERQREDDRLRQMALDAQAQERQQRERERLGDEAFQVATQMGGASNATYNLMSPVQQQAFAPDTRVSMAALANAPTVMGASTIEPARDGYVSRKALADQQAAANQFESILAGAEAMGYSPAEAQMFATRGQVPPQRPTQKAPARFDRQVVDGNVIEYEFGADGQVINQRVLTAKQPSAPQPDKPTSDERLQAQVFGSPDTPNYLSDTVKNQVAKGLAFVDANSRPLVMATIQRLASQPLTAATQQDVLGQIADQLVNPIIKAQPGAVESTMAQRLDGYMRFRQFKDRFEALAKQQGVKTGVVSSTIEGVMRSIGKTSLTKEQLELFTELQRDYVEFRRLMTGVAFSKQEAEAYSKLVALLKNEQEVNMSLLDAGMRSFYNTASNTITRFIGPDLTNAYMQLVQRGYRRDTAAPSAAGSGTSPAAGRGIFVGERSR